MHRIPSIAKLSLCKTLPVVKRPVILAALFIAIMSAQQAATAYGQSASPDTAAIQAKIDSEGALVGKAIATHDFEVIRKYWSPTMVTNNPANLIVGREQIIDSMNHGGLNYTSHTSTQEFFTVTNGAAIRMGYENLVMAAGPMAGKRLVRRATEIYQRAGDNWLLVARQATYLGFDGAILAGFVPTTYTAPPVTPEITAIQTRIDAKSQAVGRAIRAMDFGSLERLWSPALVVNSPGNNILTREQVFAAMREDKLKYSSSKAYPEAFFVSNDLAVSMGHEDIVMASGPMAGKPLKRRYTDVWQKTGEDWVMIARQATYVGIDGGAVYGHPDPTLNQQ
jgi:hypothetical protein